MIKLQSLTVLFLTATMIATATLTMPFAAASNSYSGFSDHFSGTSVDTSKWVVQNNTDMSGNPAYGGIVSVADSYIYVSSTGPDNPSSSTGPINQSSGIMPGFQPSNIGSGFPCVTSAVDPFPTSGDFTLNFDFTYTRISDWGCGFWISQGPLTFDKTNVTNPTIFSLWANNLDYNTAAIFVNLLGVQVQRQLVYGWNPSGPTENISLVYSGGFYTLTVNGAQLASEPSQLRADTVGFGHPPAYYIPFTPEHVASVVGGWSSFKIDQIKVLPQSKIALSASATSTQLGLTVDLNGTLTNQDAQPLANKTVVLSYMIPGVANWNAFTSATTDKAGTFSATWLPTATGTFAVKATWGGDEANSGTSDVKNVSVAAGTGQNILLAESNSTLTALNFNATANSVSFTVNGPSGTTGYVRFIVSKAMLTNASALTVYVDGQATQFTATPAGDLEILYFAYHHSTHDITISLSKATPVPEFQAWTMITALIAIALVLVAFKRRSQKP